MHCESRTGVPKIRAIPVLVFHPNFTSKMNAVRQLSRSSVQCMLRRKQGSVSYIPISDLGTLNSHCTIIATTEPMLPRWFTSLDRQNRGSNCGYLCWRGQKGWSSRHCRLLCKVRQLRFLFNSSRPFTHARVPFSWCGPCKMLAPLLTKSVAANPKVTLVKLNVDDAIELAKEYQVRQHGKKVRRQLCRLDAY